MDCLLFGGAQSVGKSEAIYRLAQFLLAHGFTDTLHLVPATFKDFSAVLDGLDKNGKQVKIIFNSATDTASIIENFKKFFDLHGPYDILISSVRDGGFWPRGDFFKIMDISHNSHHITEIPMAKLTRRGGNFTIALNWYQIKIDEIVLQIIHQTPYNI